VQTLEEIFLHGTICALRRITHPRFFKDERGFQGELNAQLREAIRGYDLLDCAILEEEYQKTLKRHGIRIRPDIIVHVPHESHGGSVTDRNFAVYYLKRKASLRRAQDDFNDLNLMFDKLHYRLGFFINIGSAQHHLESYNGLFKERIIC